MRFMSEATTPRVYETNPSFFFKDWGERERDGTGRDGTVAESQGEVVGEKEEERVRRGRG